MIAKDKKHNVGYITLRRGRIAKTVEVWPGVLFDVDKKGEVLGIELLSLKNLAPNLRARKKRAA